MTYISQNRKFALGLGTYSIFAFQSKLKDPAELGPTASSSILAWRRTIQNNQTLFTLRLDAYDVRSFRSSGIYALNDATKFHLGLAYTNAGFPARAITPGTMNIGGFDISGGVGKRIGDGYWLNIGVAGILGSERRIGSGENVLFHVKYSGNGLLLGIGLRR